MEWRFDRDIPLGWVVTRSVLHSFGPGAPIGIAAVIAALCSKRGLEVDDDDIDRWLGREHELQIALTGRLGGPTPLHRVAIERERRIPELEARITPPMIPLLNHSPPKIGRNETCPCGSNKKFKRCCGKSALVVR
jgi:hypothetical protein